MPELEPKSRAREQAVALTYAEGDRSPRVAAKGRGLIAQEIIKRAKAAGVYVHESPELVSLLMEVDLDERIPPQLYTAVAELLAWIYRLEAGESPNILGAPPNSASAIVIPATPSPGTPQPPA